MHTCSLISRPKTTVSGQGIRLVHTLWQPLNFIESQVDKYAQSLQVVGKGKLIDTTRHCIQLLTLSKNTPECIFANNSLICSSLE